LLHCDLNRVFFCNSGAEAVEGALKLARKYTGRSKYISTGNSFHGKTYGALSVTGREKYRKYFQPLLSDVTFIEYGNIDELEQALSDDDAAAFIMEPIQGEGGIIIPPDGFIRQAKELCHRHGALLIMDEVQTGFGRTGEMFAFMRDGAAPDILAVAKSLGGALVPIGAYVTTEDIWRTAYGNQQTYLLHTSTFGGNNFCASVGLSAIDVIVGEKLSENAATMGDRLISGLTAIAANYNFIKAVRGRGLLIGIELGYSLHNGIRNLIKLIGSMIPAKYMEFFAAFPSDILDSISDFIEDNTVNVEKFLGENFASQFSAVLLNDFNIISIVTLNNPNVIRIEPPLVITQNDVDYFLKSFRQVCEKFKIIDEEVEGQCE
jgi:acetylornithine/succinyldiaminopimelate/putrescine aminotransferase